MGLRKRFFVDIQTLNDAVTGSLHLCIAKFPDGSTIRFIVDCGLFQEKVTKVNDEGEVNLVNINEIYNKSFPFNENELDFALVTHNHVDHVGRLPLLYKNGFRGNTFMSIPTKELIKYSLNDSCKVLRETAKRAHNSALYTETDVNEALSHFTGIPYDDPYYLVPDKIKVTLFKNGHLVGAALILVQIYSDATDEVINLLFTGDYNNKNMFFTVPKLSSWLCELPVTIIQESTYGTMNSSEIEECFEQNILSGIREKKNIVIPAFSLGRYQEVLYFLKQLQEKNALDINVPIYADGKLAAAYTNMFLNNPYLGIDLEMTSFLPENVNFIFDSETRSNVIADMHSKIIVTTSGMGSYGPAQEYISKLISSSNALIHFTGYTAEGTLGRRLKDTEINQDVRIGSFMKIKRAEVMYTTEFSAHAKADEMIDFLNDFNHINFIIVNHGEPEVKEKFASRILREVNNVKEVGISSRDTFFRIDPYKCVKSMSTHFQ